MRPTTHCQIRLTRNGSPFAHIFLKVALALAASFGVGHSIAAAEIDLAGTGKFKPPSAEQMARLPAGLAFSRQDLASGTWSFLVRYDDRSADADPDPHAGRYSGAIRLFRLTVGGTTVDLPVDRAEIVVSDGGMSFPYRESIRLEASSQTPLGVMRVGWIQLNQPPTRVDLRGAPGLLAGDLIPQPSTVAKLATSNASDRFFHAYPVDTQGHYR